MIPFYSSSGSSSSSSSSSLSSSHSEHNQSSETSRFKKIKNYFSRKNEKTNYDPDRTQKFVNLFNKLIAYEDVPTKKFINLLQKRDVNINVIDGEGNTPLHTAIKMNKSAIATLLIEHGADTHGVHYNGDTVLHTCLKMGNTNLAQFLIERGADIDAVDSEGNTPLNLCFLKGYRDLAQFLIERGADVNKANLLGFAPLHIAINDIHSLRLVNLLIKHGADLNQKTNKDNIYSHSPLDFIFSSGASDYENSTKILPTRLHVSLVYKMKDVVVMTLIKMGVDFKNDPKFEERAEKLLSVAKEILSRAITNDILDEARLLISRGIALDDLQTTRALETCIRHNRIKAVQVLIEMGADINKGNDNGDTPLHQCVINNRLEIAKLLIENGANPNKTNDQGIAPLHMAVNYIEMLKLAKILIRYGADVNLKTTSDGNSQYTPLELLWVKNLEIKTSLNLKNMLSKSEKHEISTLLIQNNAEFKECNQVAVDLFFLAIECNEIDFIHFLIAREVKLNEYQKGIALCMSAQYGHIELVLLFIEMGFDINAQIKGKDPLLIIATRGGDINMVQLLLDHNINRDIPMQDGLTALEFAAMSGQQEIFQLLLTYPSIL